MSNISNQMSSIMCNLNDLSPGAERWYYVFQRLFDIPLKSSDPVRVEVPGYGVTEAYFLDLDRLTPGEIYRFELDISSKFKIPFHEVRKELLEKGCPVLAVDLNFTFQQVSSFSKPADDYFEEDRIGDIS